MHSHFCSGLLMVMAQFINSIDYGTLWAYTDSYILPRSMLCREKTAYNTSQSLYFSDGIELWHNFSVRYICCSLLNIGRI